MLQALIDTGRIPARILLAVGLILLLCSGQLHAQPRAGKCGLGPGLGSTLLIPYFEVDPASANGKTTLIAVNNGLSTPMLVRLVLWTDWGVPTLAFDVFLTGFDVQTINLRDLFNGYLPATGAGVDLSSYPNCAAYPPTYSSPVFPSMIRNDSWPSTRAPRGTSPTCAPGSPGVTASPAAT